MAEAWDEASYYAHVTLPFYMYISAHSYHLHIHTPSTFTPPPHSHPLHIHTTSFHTAFVKEDTQSLRETTAKEEAAETVNKNSARSLDQCRG